MRGPAVLSLVLVCVLSLVLVCVCGLSTVDPSYDPSAIADAAAQHASVVEANSKLASIAHLQRRSISRRGVKVLLNLTHSPLPTLTPNLYQDIVYPYSADP